MKLLIKIGGAQLGDQTARQELATAIAKAQGDGHLLIVVHGGGDQIRCLTHRLGIEDRYHDGLRITDAKTAEAVLMVLGGQVNRHLVADLNAGGVRAVGITGADGGTFSARPLQRPGIDLGYVGTVHRVDNRLVSSLLDAGTVPVIATVAPLHRADGEEASREVGRNVDAPSRPATEHFYNINADHCAGPLAHAFGADTLLFLTDVPGVMDANEQRIQSLTATDCAALRTTGVIHGGMIPKVEAALLAANAHPSGQVKIAPAAGDDAVRKALRSDTGTVFHDG